MAIQETDPCLNFRAIREELNTALKEAGRDHHDLAITAITKTHAPGQILPLLEAGHRIFGENRVQEAQKKWPALREKYPDIELHLVGPLQSNKAGDAVQLFDVIETVDRSKIARTLAAACEKYARRPEFYVQVNTGEEPQKAGVGPGGADAFIAQCKNGHGLTIDGLMCIPPAGEAPAPHFALLRKIAVRNGLKKLSMGMSGDYIIAAQMGATSVRIGSAIFGARMPRQ